VTTIALEREALEAIAQQMDSQMIVAPALANELRELIKAAKPAPDPDLVADMVLELRSFGQCRGAVHGDPKNECSCRLCRILRRLPK
jgi:hypothetical protein